MICILYTNSDLIEGRGSDVIVGVSTNLEFLKNLAYDLPCSMGYNYPQAEIYVYEDSSKIKKDQSKTFKNSPAATLIQHWCLSGRNGQWSN